MKNREAQFGILLRHWFRANSKSMSSCHIEIKDTRGENYFYFRELSEEQITVGLACTSDRGCLLRASSGTVGQGDYHFYRNAPSWVIIKYSDEFFIIGLETLLMEKDRSKRKSLTQDRARDICVKSIKLKS